MVGSSLLGFRRPRFSEEVAWLPAWLQQHVDGESLDEQYINGGQNTLEQKGFTASGTTFSSRDIELQYKTGNNANLSSRDEGRYTSCHLFLSGEDNSPASFAPSSGKVVNFNLHLSTDSKSQDTPSSPLDTSQAGRHANVSAVREETENQFRMGYNASVIGLSPFTSQQKTLDHICLQSLAKDKDSRMNREESGGYCMVSDINEAIELSIAASEALVIHDMVKSSAYTESLAAAAVLEVSLLVKQARLECLEDCFHFSTEDVNEIDCLSDLDEFHMADAFEDVGLSISNPDGRHACASGKSQVKDTPGSQNHYGCDDKYKYECLVPPKVVSDDIPRTQQSKYFLDIEKQGEKDWPVEVLDFGRQSKWVDDLTSNIDTSVVASHSDYLLHGSSLANSYVPATTEGGSFVIDSMTAYPPQPSSNSSQQAWNYVTNETRDKLTSVGPDRFQSRWLGGWAWKKEVNVSTLVEHENATKVPRYFVGETSYLSESADIAPDESSFVQKQVKGSHMDSQSSISFPGLPSRPDEGILFSLDVVRSSSLSYVDPLCSVVPCSISSENACSTPAERTNNEFDVGECSRHESQDCNVNLQRASSPNPEWGTVEIVNGEGFQPTIRRHLTSLRSYSMLLPPCGAFAGNDNTYHNRSVPSEYISGLLSAEHDVGCKRDSTGLPSLKSLKKCSTARGIEENLEPSVVQNLVTNLMNQERNCHETANDGTGLQVHTEKSRCSPVILNRGRRSRFWASKESANDFSGEENLQQSVVWKGDVGPHGKNLQTVEFKCKVAGDTEVPPRKQVRFLDAKIQLPQENSLQKLQSSNRASTTRAGKRLRYPKPKFVSTAQEVKRHQTICLAKNAKRLIFRDIEFLLTGLSIQKEKQLEGVIIKYGGIVRGDIPSPPKSRSKRSSTFKLQQLPIVLCFRKLETTKFLYGCAVNAYILDASWLTDSVAAGSALPPNKYMVIANHVGQECTRVGRPLCRSNHNHIFNRVGIMFQGKHSFCTRLAKVVKHGGGLVFKTLQWLVQNLDANRISVGAIVAEDENRVSRHLKHCASERKIPMMPASWIISSLHAGKLLPFLENKHYSPLPTIKISDFPSSSVLSEEI